MHNKSRAEFFVYKDFLVLCYSKLHSIGDSRASRVASASSHDTNQSQMLNTLCVLCSLLCSTQIDTGKKTVLTKLIQIKHLTSGLANRQKVLSKTEQLHQFLI